MQVFYKDKTKLFECQISVDGANLKETKARLILEFPERNLMFHGKINSTNGKCKIKIPALKEMDEVEGKAVLEVIAESTHFESWSDKFKIKTNKKVQVEMVDNDDSNLLTEDSEEIKPTVSVITENVDDEPETLTEVVETKPLMEETTPMKPMSDDVVEYVKYLDESNLNYDEVIKNKTLFLESIVGFKNKTNHTKEKVLGLVNELKSLNS